ncbi:MAG: oligosaccharide flippase family protein [Phycisphaerae bacterium]|nr:oligosaccharide flippase family protein [Phycisphaerae bacterium]
MTPPSLKVNFAWAFIGNAFYALCGYLMLTILAKTASVETVGLWGIAQAVTLPVATFFSLRLYTVNITDIRNEYQTGHYIAVRLLASLASIGIVALIGFLFYPAGTAIVIALMGLSQSIAEIRLYFSSNMQKYERLNLSTLAQIFEGVLTLSLFGLFLWCTKHLSLAIVGTIVSRIAILLLYDMPVSGKVVSRHLMSFSGYRPQWEWPQLCSLFWQSAPLAVVAGIGAVFQNIPRLVMDHTLGRKAVGYFTAMSLLLIALTMINAAMGNTCLPRLSRYFKDNTKAFVRLLLQLIGINALLGFGFVVVAFCFGKPILRLLFTPEYAQHQDVFVALAASSCILSIFGVSNWGLNATRQFAVQMPIYIGTAIVCGISSWLLIPRYGLMGGAYAFLICYLFGTTICLLYIVKAIRRVATHAG